MPNFNKSIDAYLTRRKLKEHDTKALELIQADFRDLTGKNILDIGCATGSFIEYMSLNHPAAIYTGIDLSAELIEIAKKNVKGNFLVKDALTFAPENRFDIIIAQGVLSIFDDFTIPLQKWLNLLDSNGKLYLFGRFNSRDIDTVIHFKNNYRGATEWEGGLVSYSTKTIERFSDHLGYDASFTRFNLSIDLAEDLDPIRTYTRKTVDGEKIVLNGANVIAEHFFCRLSRR